MATNLYLIEDDTRIHDFVRASLAVKPDWRLVGVSDSLAHARVHAGPALADVYLVDLGLPDGRGETLLQLLAQTNPEAEKLVFTVFGEESRLIGALEAGATGYVLKGCSGPELVAAVELIRTGGAPISALLARMLLNRFRATPATAPNSEMFQSGNPLPLEPLSEREIEVLKLVAQGYVNKEIARKLEVSGNTVATHVKNLYRKLSVHSRAQVVRAAIDRGFV